MMTGSAETIKFDIQNLDLYYGSFKALKNVNLGIPEMR